MKEYFIEILKKYILPKYEDLDLEGYYFCINCDGENICWDSGNYPDNDGWMDTIVHVPLSLEQFIVDVANELLMDCNELGYILYDSGMLELLKSMWDDKYIQEDEDYEENEDYEEDEDNLKCREYEDVRKRLECFFDNFAVDMESESVNLDYTYLDYDEDETYEFILLDNKDFENCENIKKLTLRNFPFLPEWIGCLRNLEELYIDNCKIDKTINVKKVFIKNSELKSKYIGDVEELTVYKNAKFDAIPLNVKLFRVVDDNDDIYIDEIPF